MSDPGTGRVVLAYAAAFAVVFVLLIARGIWHRDPAWRIPLCLVGFLGLMACVLVTLNTLSVGGPR